MKSKRYRHVNYIFRVNHYGEDYLKTFLASKKSSSLSSPATLSTKDMKEEKQNEEKLQEQVNDNLTENNLNITLID